MLYRGLGAFDARESSRHAKKFAPAVLLGRDISDELPAQQKT